MGKTNKGKELRTEFIREKIFENEKQMAENSGND